MPNTNTVAQAISSAGKFCPSPSQGVSSSAEFQFADAASSGNALIAWLPGSNKLQNRPIRIRMWGRVTTGGAYTFTGQIYLANAASSQTLANSTSIATTGAVTYSTVSGNFHLEVIGVWDSTSTYFQGTYDGYANGTAKTQTICTSVSKPALAPSTEGLAVTASGTFGTSHASNLAVLDGLEIEAL